MNLGNVAGWATTILVTVVLIGIVGVFCAGVGLAYANEHVHRGQDVHNHSTAGIMVVSSGVTLLFVLLVALIISLAVTFVSDVLM